MQEFNFRTGGVCSRMLSFSLDDDNKVHDVSFMGGCNGNLKGIGALVEGMPAEDIVERLSGTRCGGKSTSCPDQLARALQGAMKQKAEQAQQ